MFNSHHHPTQLQRFRLHVQVDPLVVGSEFPDVHRVLTNLQHLVPVLEPFVVLTDQVAANLHLLACLFVN